MFHADRLKPVMTF